MSLTIEVGNPWNCVRVPTRLYSATCLEPKLFNYALTMSGQDSDDHGHYMHAEEITTVNMSTSNSFSRLIPNRRSHLS